jgi:hypothetical protein
MKKNFLQKIYNYFSNFEFNNRSFLSRHRLLYALIGGAGVVLYWRGIWHTGDLLENSGGIWSTIFSPVGSILIGVVTLLSIGLLVQSFIGQDIIISGLKKEEKEIDKTEEELITEENKEAETKKLIKEIDDHLHKIEERLEIKE